MHLLDLPKLKTTLEGQTDEASGQDLFEVEKAKILKEESFALGYFRQSIELSEKTSNVGLDLTKFDELLKLDLEVDGIENLTEDEENEYFALLNGDNVGKAITNMAEYLLMTQAMKGEIKVSFIT